MKKVINFKHSDETTVYYIIDTHTGAVSTSFRVIQNGREHTSYTFSYTEKAFWMTAIANHKRNN